MTKKALLTTAVRVLAFLILLAVALLAIGLWRRVGPLEVALVAGILTLAFLTESARYIITRFLNGLRDRQ